MSLDLFSDRIAYWVLQTAFGLVFAWCVTQDWRAIPLYVVLFAIYFTVWLPFFKVYEKECIMEEANEAAENEEYETSSDAAGIAEA